MKTFQIKILLIYCFLNSQNAFGQHLINYGLELGINSAGLPKKITTQAKPYLEEVNSTTFPVISPVVGVWSKLNYCDYFYSSVGVQYYQVGSDFENHITPNDRVFAGKTYFDDQWTKFRFDKISIPLSMGINFKIKKIKASVFYGKSINYMFAGSYYDKHVIVRNYFPISNYYEVETTNPLDTVDYNIAAKPLSFNFLAGINCVVSKKINFNLIVTQIQSIEFFNHHGGDFGISKGWAARDFKFSIKYSFN